MRLLSILLFLTALTAPNQSFSSESPATDLRPVLNSDATGYLLGQWFALDPTVSTQVERIELASDEIGRRYRLEFDGEDGQRVNGFLAMPAVTSTRDAPRVAFALHPMGTDHAIWLDRDNPIQAGLLTETLRRNGFAVLGLDARNHGERRREHLGFRTILEYAHGDHPRPYDAMISNTLRDYRQLLHWVRTQGDLRVDGWFAMGYSMGAQMSLILAALEPGAGAVLAMVPPYVDRMYSPSAPRNHIGEITQASVMLMAGRDDPYSSADQTRQVFDALGTEHKQLIWFDSEHLLPESYIQKAVDFIAARAESKGRK
ncbi:MAG: alpha/beta hydrolase [Wenzhouxiangellaceae bacterium]